MNSEAKIKQIEGKRLYIKILILGCFSLFTFFLLRLVIFYIRDFQRGYSAVGIKYLIFVLISILILAFLAFGLPYLLYRLYPNIYYFDDGFRIGKNGEKILYKNLDYFFTPAPNKTNSFIDIKFKYNNNPWQFIPATGYSPNSFNLFQKDFVDANYSEAMKKIENGETMEFLFNNPKKPILGLGKKRYVEKKLEQALKIKISKESIIFDNEKYDWDKYKIFASAGSIIVQDKAGNTILSLGQKALIHRVNLLEAIINSLGTK